MQIRIAESIGRCTVYNNNIIKSYINNATRISIINHNNHKKYMSAVEANRLRAMPQVWANKKTSKLLSKVAGSAHANNIYHFIADSQ